MKMRLTWLLILMLALTVFWGCSDDDDPVVPPVVTSFEVMATAGAAYVNDSEDCPGVISATALDALLTEDASLYTIIDIRSLVDYNLGHIPGAVRSSTVGLLSDLASGTIPVAENYVVTCYTGQEAGHVKIAMELLGYENVKSLLWGMSAWNTATAGMDHWSGNCGDNIEDLDTTDNNGELTDHDLPVLTESAVSVVAERVADMLSNGFQKITYQAFEALPDEDVFVINYFPAEDYMPDGPHGVPGHIDGAYQFRPYQTMAIDQWLKKIPTDKTIIVYCWTGQHSSQITAYLNMLGYNAKSLLFGSNHLFHGDLTGHKWTVAGQGGDFELEVTPTMAANF